MTNQRILPQLLMRKTHLCNLPKIEIPAGYEIRWFREGDQQAWEKIIGETFDSPNCSFDSEIKADPPFQPERVLFVTMNDDPVATASAWQKDRFGPKIGYLHMVGVRPDHQGKNLGYWVSLAVLYRFVTEGKFEAVLETDDYRIPAIKTYLKMGFEPLLVHENQRPRWRTVFENARRTELIEKYQSILDGPVF